MKFCFLAACLLLLLGATHAQQAQLETARLPQRNQRTEFPVSAFKFTFSSVTGPSRVSNAAVMQLQWDKGNDQFLSTLPAPGQSQFLTVLKPCGLILPHVHQRATEFYSILSGTMAAGIAQENGGAQNITLEVRPGEVLVVPQGLLHFNNNPSCTPLAFFQSFSSSDPGALNVIGALAALGGAGPLGTAAIRASIATGITASPQGAFGLDPACLTTCGLGATGAPGDGLADLPAPFRAMLGLDATATPAAGTPAGTPAAGTPAGTPAAGTPAGTPAATTAGATPAATGAAPATARPAASAPAAGATPGTGSATASATASASVRAGAPAMG